MTGPQPHPPASGKKARWQSRRSPHRMRSHEEAHAGHSTSVADHHEPWSVVDHPLVSRSEPVMVSTQAELQALIDRLRLERCFAYDSEFIGEHSYHPKLCVIQVAIGGCNERAASVLLIDPLAGIDLTEFWRLLADDSVEKIVHAGLPDLEPVFRHLNVPARHVFDTQIAAAFAGLSYPLGLAKLVKELAGAELAQSLKFSQWDHRPLSRVQVRYAANDVRYLPLIRSLLMERLEARNNAPWALEECQSLSDVDLYRFDEQAQRMRVRDIESLRPRQRAILANLISWREEAARQEDVPARTLLKDGLLVDMARWPPKSVEELNRVKGMPRPVKQHYGAAIIAAIGAAVREPVPDDLKRTNRQGRRRYDRDADRPVVDLLWKQAHDKALARGIDMGVVTSKKEIARIRAKALNGDSSHETRLTGGWRRELLGPMFEPQAMNDIRAREAIDQDHVEEAGDDNHPPDEQALDQAAERQ